MQPWVSGSLVPRKVQDLINITDGLWQPASRSSLMCLAPPSTQQNPPSSNTRQKSENMEHILLELLEKFDAPLLPNALGDQGPAQALCSWGPAAAAPAPPPAPQSKALGSWGPAAAVPAAAEVPFRAPTPPASQCKVPAAAAPAAAAPAAPEAPRHAPAPAWAPAAPKPDGAVYSWPRRSAEHAGGPGPAAAGWLLSVPPPTCQDTIKERPAGVANNFVKDPAKERQTALAHIFLKDFAQAASRYPAKQVKEQNPYGKKNTATEAFFKAAAAIQLQNCRGEENEVAVTLQHCNGEENEFALNGYDYASKMWTASTPRFTTRCMF